MFLFLIVGTSINCANATSYRQQANVINLVEIVNISDSIVSGEVIGFRVLKPDKGNLLKTQYFISIDSAFSLVSTAARLNTYTIELPGGVRQGDRDGEYIYQKIEGTPRLEVGEKILAFMSGNREVIYPFSSRKVGVIKIVDGYLFTENGLPLQAIAADGDLIVKDYGLSEARHRRDGEDTYTVFDSATQQEEYQVFQVQREGGHLTYSQLSTEINRIQKTFTKELPIDIYSYTVGTPEIPAGFVDIYTYKSEGEEQ